MADLEEAIDKLIEFRPLRWAGYLAWIVILLLLLSFMLGNLAENQPRAALFGGILFVIIFELGIGIRMLGKSIMKKKQARLSSPKEKRATATSESRNQ